MQKWIIACYLLFSFALLAKEPILVKKKYFTQRTTLPIKLDGKLDEASWQSVDWGGGDFIIRTPNEGESPSESTVFKILYDANNIYVGVRAYDPEPDKIETQMSRRDGFAGDWVEINIDSYFDHQTAFSFTISASGVRGDEFISQDGNNWDSSWDPVWHAKTSIDDEGWIAEMQIPLSQLRYGSKEDHVWGIQFTRRVYRKNERSNWQFIPQNSTGWVHKFGELHGIKGIKAQRQVELLPYSVAKRVNAPAEAGNPFATGTDNDLAIGLDGKIGLSGDFTMDLTINPDFGQVEADPSEVNLTAFESFFREKRPFFIEGRNILDFQVTEAAWGGSYSSDNLFYSRRIGRRPIYSPDLGDDEYMEKPQNTSILGAVKISGKTKSGLSIGILESVTSQEKATIDLFGNRREETVEPLSNYFAGRVQQDFKQGNTTLGAMFTATNRKIDDTQLNFLHTQAYSGGVDFLHNIQNRNYYLSANAIFSRVSGDAEAILRTQTRSTRYFQRPDADHLTLDSTRTSLDGHGGTVRFGKRGNFKFQSGATWRSPGLELNDIGFLSRADEVNQWTWVGYRITKPFSIFNNISLNANERFSWDFGGQSLGGITNVNSHIQFKNQWRIGGGLTYEFDNISNSRLRGGPSLKLPGGVGTNIYVNSDQRKNIMLNFGYYNFVARENAADIHNFWMWTSYRPSNAMSLSFNPFYTTRNRLMQFVGTQEMNNDDRYLFGTIDQKTLGVTFRLNYSITPNFTIEYYGSPFVSAGEYMDFKRITDPLADRLDQRYAALTGESVTYADDVYSFDENGDGVSDYSLDNPDFNFREFNSNLVVRWEYHPGSTLYLVWSQGRSSFVNDGRFSYRRDLNDLFSSDAQNVFLLKISRWFSM